MTKINVPVNAAEIAEYLNEPTKVSELVKNGQLTEFMDAYKSASAKNDPEIAVQTREQMQSVLVDFLRESKEESVQNGLKPGNGGKDTSVFNRAAAGSKVEHEFDGVANFFQETWHANKDTSSDYKDKLNRLRNAFSSGDGASGGFLVPETMRSEILSLSLEEAVVRPRATVIPMSSGTLLVPSNDSTTNVGSTFGGITAYWTSEGDELVASNPTFSRTKLEANKLITLANIPNELLQDGVALEAFVAATFPRAVAFAEDDAFLNGNGAGQPQGIYNSPAGVVVAKESGQDADTVLWQNIVKMYSRMLPSSIGRAVWVVSPDTFPELATMALSVGTGGSAIWLTNGVQAPQLTILGRPVVISEKAPSLGNEGDIMFVDMSYYLIGDRQGMTMTNSAHNKFEFDVTSYRVIERVTGRVWLNSAITPANSGPTLSPIVKLAERA